MKYIKFILENYKAITSPIVIDLNKNSLIPIIGINECGKTTILNAIFAFDSYNDDLDSTIHHLTDIKNLYTTEYKPARISAIIEISKKEIKEFVKKYFKEKKDVNTPKKIKFPKILPDVFELKISRVFDSKKVIYQFEETQLFKHVKNINDFCIALILELPYILYFDDFKDAFPDKVEIKKGSTDSNQTWLSIIEQLFEQTNKSYDVFEIPGLESRQRKSILGDVEKHLNKSLTKEWSNFRLEEKELLQIAIEYFSEEESVTKDQFSKNALGQIVNKPEIVKVVKHYLKFEVIDKDAEGNKRYFYVRDRSKGFYWFFNFVMKLEFNPKISGSELNAIYLLDEPGSYLHSFAQTKLCKKLKVLSETHKVLYCTHSHYLLNPEIIPLNTIHVANKSESGEVQLINYHKYNSPNGEFPTAFQPVYDALQLQPIPFEFANLKTLLVEGIFDFYSFSLCKGDRKINIFPCKGADSISYFISLFLGFRINYVALWDNDQEGNKAFKKATTFFGDYESANFYLLPVENEGQKKIIQNLFDGLDMKMFKNELNIDNDASFEKTISNLYFSNKKEEIIKNISQKTLDNFNAVFSHVKL